MSDMVFFWYAPLVGNFPHTDRTRVPKKTECVRFYLVLERGRRFESHLLSDFLFFLGEADSLTVRGL